VGDDPGGEHAKAKRNRRERSGKAEKLMKLDYRKYRSGSLYRVHGTKGIILAFAIATDGSRMDVLEGECAFIELDIFFAQLPGIFKADKAIADLLGNRTIIAPHKSFRIPLSFH
jgi:hypothetical protein